ncbi:carbohydrate sulfotransferase 1-like [Homarus americanus]|uniref:carbohydrate sulfotransferase 1-like n=1 Tax=Homarus americanus TaxID=6706 RepID=UPI001C447375|nr:carbohydrate sulfotransferase 1-like [Homarus americanus]
MALKIKLVKMLMCVAVSVSLYYVGVQLGDICQQDRESRSEDDSHQLSILDRVPQDAPGGGFGQDGVLGQEVRSHEEDKREGKKDNSEAASSSSPMFVLLLSSMARGGSTFMVEVLGKIHKSVVFFEPLWPVEKKACINDEKCVEQYLTDVFTCNYKPDFERWLKAKYGFLTYFNSDVRRCLLKQDKKKSSDCIHNLSLREMCEESPVRIIKVIRARLSWLEDMLSDPLMNLKIIHLTRDPRGSLNSIRKFGRWGLDLQGRCSALKDDIDAYGRLSQKFPSKLLQIHLEDMCLHPENVTGDIFNFLFGSSNLSAALRIHLTSHTTKEGQNNPMSTTKDSKKEFEAWRYKIPEKLLQEVEAEPSCIYAIQRMNHAVFGTSKNAKNSIIPLILT